MFSVKEYIFGNYEYYKPDSNVDVDDLDIVINQNVSKDSISELSKETIDEFKYVIGTDKMTLCHFKDIDLSNGYYIPKIAYDAKKNYINLKYENSLSLLYEGCFLIINSEIKLPINVNVELEKYDIHAEPFKKIKENGLDINVSHVNYNILD